MNQNALSKISEALSHAGEDPRLLAQLQRLEARRITPDTLIPPREFLFRLFSIPCFPRGELVAITGKEKSGKTFVTSLLMTLCVRREALSMARNVDEGLRLLWYDTEQSEESTQEILVDRIRRMICQSADLFESAADSWLDRFFVYNVSSESWRDRLPLLETAIVEHHPDLVVLDGIRDLVDDINDGVLSQSVVERLMHLASDGSCCIVCVLHQNKSGEDHNLRGWIGTELTYKSFEVYECVKDADRIFSFQQIRTRKFDILDKMRFVVDSNGLPQLCSIEMPNTSSSKSDDLMVRPPLNRKYVLCDKDGIVELDYRLLFRDCMPESDMPYQAGKLQQAVMSLANITSPYFYNKWRLRALAEGVIAEAPKDERGHVMYVRHDIAVAKPPDEAPF